MKKTKEIGKTMTKIDKRYPDGIPSPDRDIRVRVTADFRNDIHRRASSLGLGIGPYLRKLAKDDLSQGRRR